MGNEYGSVMSTFINQTQSQTNNQGVMYGSSSSTCKFKRYNLLDLFDEQYGHLQRNEMLDNQEQQQRTLNVHHNSSAS